MNPQPHLMRQALYQHIKDFTKYRNGLVDFLMADGILEDYTPDGELKGPFKKVQAYQRNHILKDIRTTNSHLSMCYNYDKHISLMIESGSVIRSFDQWMSENKPVDIEAGAKEKLNDIKSGRYCLYDNVTTTEQSLSHLHRILMCVDPHANFKKLKPAHRWFYYNKQKAEWHGEYSGSTVPFVSLSDVMHLRY